MTHDLDGADKPWYSDPAWLEACFVASLVTARMYLNVLGIGKEDNRLTPFVARRDDITVDDLGGRRVDVKKLFPDEKQLILNFLTMADKAAAHFTSPMSHDWDKTHDVIKIVHRLLKTQLYDPTGRTGLEPLQAY
ncbi:MAG TPA: hypothetical protein VGK48_17580 [Terriglobia bacterium]|jgi:hypothetical protein